MGPGGVITRRPAPAIPVPPSSRTVVFFNENEYYPAVRCPVWPACWRPVIRGPAREGCSFKPL